MTTGEIVTAIVGGVVTVAGGFFALVRWFVTVWRDVRREELAVSRESSAAQRADANRTIEVQLELSSATAALASKVDHIPSRIAELLWREHTPVEGIPIQRERERAITNSDPPSERRRMQAAEQPLARFPGDRPPGRPPGRRND